LLAAAYLPSVDVAAQVIPYSCYWYWSGLRWHYVCYYNPQYYYYYYQQTNVGVTISIAGMPSEYSTAVRVDGNPVGSISGGSSNTFRVRFGETHTFQVDQYVSGPQGVRYRASDNTWTIDTIRADDAHSFTYTVEYEVSVSDPYGKSESVWRPPGSKVSLEAKSIVEVSPGRRERFEGWQVDGALSRESSLTLDVTGPKRAVAKYVSEVLLTVNSPYGGVSGGGWHPRDSTVPLSVDQTSIAAPGMMGLLGARYVFVRFVGDVSTTSPNTVVLMDKPKVTNAVWTEDYTYTYMTIVGILIAVILGLYLTGRLPLGRRPQRRGVRRGHTKGTEGPSEA